MKLRGCECFNEFYNRQDELDDGLSGEEYEMLEQKPLTWQEKDFHRERPSETSRAWDVVKEVIEHAARSNATDLILSKLMDRDDYLALNTLPASIGNLKNLRRLVLYGSNISYIPREIGGCVSLENFDPYCSYRLHWFPAEILKCTLLRDSTVSTRALYGNYKLRPPFPNLRRKKWKWTNGPEVCASCETESDDMEQYWVTRRVATDYLPLLTSVCSQACLSKLIPTNNKSYIQYPHQGSLMQKQPPMEF